ncbi:hypothetical protein FRC10_003156 [Ceratobasidium sp. 414]|nr:hypothetical protein FRC10_003156 [Ceratobasidium sp. 414]
MLLPRVWLLALAVLPPALAISTGSCVSFDNKAGGFQIAATGSAEVLVSPDEWPGVVRAAGDFARDLSTRLSSLPRQVTGKTLSVANATSTTASQSKTPIIVGTLGHSALISAVVNNTKLDVSSISGKWESFIAQQVSNPLPGVSSAYVVIGGDKRVINDEQPALQSWAQEKYTNGTGPPFNHLFYANVFELLLRLRANYLWPAMWSGMFYVDDKANAALADYYGIVMGTSHQEPMARATPNEWGLTPRGLWNFTSNAANVTQYWIEGVQRAAPYETMYTLGMRGEGDMPLEESTNIKNLEDVVAAQRKILAQVYNKSDATTIPQMWCLYKEVQSYYAGEISADIQSTMSETVQEALEFTTTTLASDRGANSIWIVNVGDLKPYEMAIEYFIALGRDVNRWRDASPSSDSVQTFVTQWATREFNAPTRSDEIARLVRNMTMFNARRKHELLNGTTYSLVNYHEAENIVATWNDMVSRSQAIYKSLPSGTQPAYFQLVHHPIQASSIVQNLYYTVGRNNLYASQARLSTNALADQAAQIFDSDYDLEAQYHSLLNGKWDHFMDQTHLGYYYWQQA